MKENIAMDFNKLINDLLAQGEDVDKLASQFTEALNAASAANKSKKERDKYIADARESVIHALATETESFATAATVAMMVAARTYPKMTLQDLQEYEVATRNAMKATAGFHNDVHAEGKDLFSAIVDCLAD
jgi:DNA polymerase III gamma/tau subunit